MKTIDIIKNYCGAGLLLMAVAMTMNSCSEDIDDSDLYTFTGEMMIDHFENNPDMFSSYLTILGQVHPSNNSPSTMLELLDARGAYTCFAPTNEAVQVYLDSLLRIGEVETTNVAELPDSVAKDIVFNSIIENREYASTDFTEGPLETTNMNDRYVDISTVSEDAKTVLLVNKYSKILKADIEVENGYIHAIDKVLSPSKASVADLVIATPNTYMFGELLKVTGWADRLLVEKDTYSESDDAGKEVSGRHGTENYPEYRKKGYTIFVETDDVFIDNGITNDDNFLPSLKEWLRNNAYYDEATTSYGDDYTSEDNAVNQFVAYHILPEMLRSNRLVIFSNEKGFYNGEPNDGTKFITNVWEYYETMGKHRRLLKITGTRLSKRLNRYSVYNSAYREDLAKMPESLWGIEINDKDVYENDAINGFFYTIKGMHVWHREVPGTVLNERMRFDICSLLPEMMTNNIRYNKPEDNRIFPTYYFDNITYMDPKTEFWYLPNTRNTGEGQWMNYQTDEFNVSGQYDFTMKLPPVPFTDTYEIRYGINANENRGMGQVYIGTNPENLPAVGIPLDLREYNERVTGWVSDTGLSQDERDENDKAMRNNGYMKGPAYFFHGANSSGRDNKACLRRIIYTGQLEAGETYYIRFKSVLSSKTTEFFFDYLEFVPKSVFSGDEQQEDKW